MAAPAIEFKGVHKWFGKHHVLRDINLAIEPGEVVVVCGPSGSGKSTLIRCVNVLERIQQGDLVVLGESVTAPGLNLARLRSQVGMVFQQFNLFAHMTVLQNITLAPMKVKRVRRAEAEETARRLLARVGIPDRADYYPANLSGGQQQRVAIARALAMSPKVMLFDEPTSALDPIATASIEELINDLKDKVTILIVTHNMQQAARVSDFTAYMYLGEMIEFGATDAIFIKPRNKATEDYITGRFG